MVYRQFRYGVEKGLRSFAIPVIMAMFFVVGWFAPVSFTMAQTIQAGVQKLSHNQTVSFPVPFKTPPVVLTSAQISRIAVSSAAVNITANNFLLYLTSHEGSPVSNAWVQWIAFIPDQSKEVIGGVIQASHGQHISFPKLSATPVIVTNAQKLGKALISGAMNNSPSGFDLYLVDDNGNPVKNAWVLWMAVVPSQQNGFKGEVRLRNDGDIVTFTPPFARGPAYVLSAQPGVIAGAVDNRLDGFILSLIKHDGSLAKNAWTQWLGFAGPPAPPDTQAPVWPAGSTLRASNIGQTSLTMTWTAAQDNVGVTSYRLYRNSTLIATLGSVLSYNVTGLTPNTQYTFKVEAGDAAGNWSTTGPSVSVRTLPPQPAASGNLVAPSTSGWKSCYTVGGKITNIGQVNIESVQMILYEDGKQVFPSPLSWTQTIPPGGIGDLGWSFRKDWQWWTDYTYAPLHDLTKTFRYYISSQWKDANGETHNLRIPSTGEIEVKVEVPESKQLYAYDAAAALSAAISLSVVAVWYPPAAIVQAAELALYEISKAQAEDPPEVDTNYRSVAQLRVLPLEIPEGRNPPEKAFRQVAFGLRDLVAALELFTVSRNRAWGAFAYGEDQPLLLQAQGSAKAAELCKKRSKELAGHLRTLAAELKKAGTSLSREQVLDFQKKIRTEGLPKEEVELLQNWGYGEKIKFFIDALQHVDPGKASQLEANILNQAESLEGMSKAIDTVLNQIQELTKVKTDKERQKKLFEAGLLTLEEVRQGKTKITPK